MFRSRALVLVLCVFILFESAVSAASNVWSHNSPKVLAGGKLSISGTATADSGFTLGKTGVATVWPAGRKGGIVTSFSISVDPTTGKWSTTLTGLSPETVYVVVVQVTQSKGNTTQTIATSPRVREIEDGNDDDQ